MIAVLLEAAQGRNRGAVARAVRSVLAQSAPDLRLFVCGDMRDPGVEEYLLAVAARDGRVTVLGNETPIGSPARCLARAFVAASGAELVTWMSDCHVLLPGAIERLRAPFVASSALDFAFGSVVRYAEDGSRDRVGKGTKAYFEALPEEIECGLPAGVLARPRIFDSAGFFDPSPLLRGFHDDLFRRLVGAGDFEVVHFDVAEDRSAFHSSTRMPAFPLPAGIARKYCTLRDGRGERPSLDRCLNGPLDAIPGDGWTLRERELLNLSLLEYFLSIGDAAKAAECAERACEANPALLASPGGQDGDLPARSVLALGWLSQSHREHRTLSRREREIESLRIERGDALCKIDAQQRKIVLQEREHAALKHELASARKESEQKTALLAREKEAAARCHAQAVEARTQLDALRVEHSALRHRIVDSCNAAFRRMPLLHHGLKRMALLVSRSR